MSSVKETNYFSWNPYGFTRRSYERLFKNAGGATAVGEASPSYLYDPHAARAIKSLIPNCRIVIVLRNPVDRLISDYFYSRSWGSNLGIDLSTFVTACLNGEGAQSQGFAPALMARKGLYWNQVQTYLDVFNPERVFIRLYDELKADPGQMISELYSFLGVDASFIPDLRQVHNPHSEPIFPALSRFVRRSKGIEARLINPLLPSSMYGIITKSILAANRRKGTGKDVRPPVARPDRDRLIEFYRSDIEKLEQILQRNLAQWLA